MDKQTVGVLGATSLVGGYLLQKLNQNNWEITAFSRNDMTSCQRPDVTWQKLNSTTQSVTNSAPKKISSWLCVAPIWILPEYFDLLLKHGAQRIIALSSTSRFTKSASSDPKEQIIVHQLIQSEEKLCAWAKAHGIAWTILRPTLIYGQGRDKNISEIAHFIHRFGFFPLLGPAHGLRQPIHAEDVALACLAALDSSNASYSAYNITGGETLTYREMVKRVFIALNRQPRLLTIPRWAFQIAVQGLRVLPRYRHWNTAMADRMNQDLIFDCTNVKQILTFLPRPFKLTAKDLPAHI